MARRLAHVANALTLVLVLASPALAGPPPGTESYEGFDISKLAEATARLTTFRTQHGEPKGNEAFAEWLGTQNLSRSAYDRAWNLWWERFRADPTGQLEARFHRINSEWVQQLNYGDAPDRRQEKREGVTLETYAKIAVALTRLPGAKLEDVLKKYGVKGTAHWQKVNAAWGKAMREDTSYALTQQYAALYQKYAGPQFTAEYDAVAANLLAQTGKEKSAPAPTARPEPETLDQVAARMASAQGRDRMEAARQYAHACDLWSGPARKDPKDARAARCAPDVLRRDLKPVIMESVERADDRTIGFAVGLLDYLKELDLKEKGDELAIRRWLHRAEDQLARLEASFEPIKDKAVPERLPLRQKIDEYTAAVRDLRSALASW